MRLIYLAIGFLLLSVSSCFAERIYCPLAEDGNWVNPDAEPKEISRVEVDSRCENEQVHVRVRAFTSCIPRDCKWGWTKGERLDNGAIEVLLIGFLSSKKITLRAFGDVLDTHVVNITNDLSRPNREKVYNLQRKK
ncbi:serine/threonine protein kinase [Roseibium aggregatum]|uniref:Serine/threonine protein kinase n=1 Tax=Roseibium aggregatum TaxID=187304 RepID=A0A939EGL6_9HYPH|nr:serine/threonine protein kinase [Roseibium aggregatum]MBN9672857.1 serine/threonine protein kinase [Roseibium aggregatum]